MVMKAEYSEAAAQVLDILNYTNLEDVKKIPQSFINFLVEIADKNYKSYFNHNGQMSKLDLKKQTRELLGFIYITWWCNDKERNSYKNIIHFNNQKVEDIEKIDKYNVNDIFKNKEAEKINIIIENANEKATSIIAYKKESLLKKLLDKLFGFFKQ